MIDVLVENNPIFRENELYRKWLANPLEEYLAKGDSRTDLLELYKRGQNVMTERQQMTIFLCAAYHGHLDLMRKLIEFDNSVLNETNVDGYNASSIAKLNNQHDVVEFLEKEHGVIGDKPQNRVLGNVVKLLLLGAGYVGKSTIFKQLRQFYTGFNEDDRRSFIDHIHAQMIEEMKLILENIEMMAEEQLRKENSDDFKLSDDFDGLAALQNPAAKQAADLLSKVKDPKLTKDIAVAIEGLWQESVVRAVYDNRAKTGIAETSAYFWNDIQRIMASGYVHDHVPTLQDLMLVNYRTTGVIDMKLTVRDNVYHIFDTGGQ